MHPNLYYQKVFSEKPIGELFVKWSWPAFFLGTVWLAYRKGFLVAFSIFLVALALDLGLVLAFAAMGWSDLDTISFGFGFIGSLALGLYGNSIYGRICKKRNYPVNGNYPSSLWGAIGMSFLTGLVATIAVIYIYPIREDLKSDFYEVTVGEFVDYTEKKRLTKDFSDLENALCNLDENEYLIVYHKKSEEIFMQTAVDEKDHGSENEKLHTVEYKDETGVQYKISGLPTHVTIKLFSKFFNRDTSYKQDYDWQKISLTKGDDGNYYEKPYEGE